MMIYQTRISIEFNIQQLLKNLSLRLQEFPYKVGKYKLLNNAASISAIQDMVKEKNRDITNNKCNL